MTVQTLFSAHYLISAALTRWDRKSVATYFRVRQSKLKMRRSNSFESYRRKLRAETLVLLTEIHSFVDEEDREMYDTSFYAQLTLSV